MRCLPLLISLVVGLLQAPACGPSGRDTGAAGTAFETRTSTGNISFRVTPRQTAGRLIVDIQADTHSGDLSEIRLREAVVLHAGGRTYTPVEAASLSGHHAEGAVAFDVPRAVERFSVTIAGVRDMDSLTFEWP